VLLLKVAWDMAQQPSLRISTVDVCAHQIDNNLIFN
jgi:hypothetical protein